MATEINNQPAKETPMNTAATPEQPAPRGRLVTPLELTGHAILAEQRWLQGAEEWGSLAVHEIVRGAQTYGVVRSQHEHEAAYCARLAARYAFRFLASREAAELQQLGARLAMGRQGV